LAAANFKPLQLSVLGFALSNIANILNFITLYDIRFCLRNLVPRLENHVQIANQIVPWKTANATVAILFSYELAFSKINLWNGINFNRHVVKDVAKGDVMLFPVNKYCELLS
jgi:hypothetical protein